MTADRDAAILLDIPSLTAEDRTVKYHGEATSRDGPVCRRALLTQDTYVYADELGEDSGATRLTTQQTEA